MKRKLIALALSAAVVTAMPALSPRQNDMAYAADHTAVPISAAAAYAAVMTETSSSAENAQDLQQETAPTVIAIAGKTYTNSKNGKVELKARLKEADIGAALRAAADAAASQDEADVQPLRFYISASAEAKADKAVITISKTLLKKIRKQTKAPLEISTYPSSVTLDRKLMNSLISKAKGTTVDVVTEKSVLSAEQKRLFGKTAIVRKLSFRSGGKTILNPNSSGASVVLDLADLPDALQTGEIGIGRVVTGGKVYQNKFSSENRKKRKPVAPLQDPRQSAGHLCHRGKGTDRKRMDHQRRTQYHDPSQGEQHRKSAAGACEPHPSELDEIKGLSGRRLRDLPFV